MNWYGFIPLAVATIGAGYSALLLKHARRYDIFVFGILVAVDASIAAWRSLNVLSGAEITSPGVLIPCSIGTIFLAFLTFEFLAAFPNTGKMRWRWRGLLIAWAFAAFAVTFLVPIHGPWGRNTPLEVFYFIPMTGLMLVVAARAYHRSTRRDERVVIATLAFRWICGTAAYTIGPLVGLFSQLCWAETTVGALIGFVVIGTTVLSTELFSPRAAFSEVITIATLALVVVLGAGGALWLVLSFTEGRAQVLALFGATFVPLALTALGFAMYPRVERRVLAPLDERRAARLGVQGEPIPADAESAIAEARQRIAKFAEGATVVWLTADKVPAEAAAAQHTQPSSLLVVPAVGAEGQTVGGFEIQGGTIDRDTFLVARDLAGRVALSVERAQAVQELQDAKRLAALGQFAAAIAHDIRTPLTSISLNVQILRRKLQLDEDDQEHFDIALEELARLDRSVAEILDFAKPVKIVEEEIDVKELLEDAAKSLSPVISERGVSLVCVPASNLTIHGDPQRLRQVLANLVGNAADASKPGETVQLRAVGIDGHVSIEIEDKGRGIGADDLVRIFEPFFTTRPDGTGLGLSIVQKVVRAHGGDIKVRSTPGVGSTFTVVLPAA
ncbi:MAG TPA: ATP-binding protein [Kofleriaceae bacterium]|jgi:signal transduction histidine kinase